MQSPKSVAFDLVAIVTKSIVFTLSAAVCPPANTALELLDAAPIVYLEDVKSPKSTELPKEPNSTVSILLVKPLVP